MGEVAEANPEAPGLYKEETQLPLGAGTQERLFEGCL